MSASKLLALTALPLAFALAGPAAAQADALVVQGDAIPGVGTVTNVFALDVNDAGDWAAVVRTDQGTDVLLRNGTVFLKDGDGLPTPAPLSQFRSAASLDLSATGDLRWVLTGSAGGGIIGSAVFEEQSDVVFFGAPITAAGITPGTPFHGFWDAVFDEAGAAVVHAELDDPAITGINDNTLFLLVPQGGGGFTQTVIAKRGDLLPGMTTPVQDFAESDHGLDLNEAGQVFFRAGFLGPEALYLDQALVAKTGGQSPVFGRTWASFFQTPLALNDDGDFVFGARMTGSFDTDRILVWNGIKLVQEGDSLPDIAPFALQSLGLEGARPMLRITEDARVVWYGQWNDADDTRDSGLFLDHQLFLREGVTNALGLPIDDFAGAGTTSPIFDVSGSGEYVAFRAVLQDGRVGAFLVRTKADSVEMIDCAMGGNTGTLTAGSGPKLGVGLGFQLFDPQIPQPLAILAVSTSPIAGWPPCGLPLPGIGDVVVDLVPPNPVLLLDAQVLPVNPPFGFATLPLPNDLQLLGVRLYAQGFFFDASPGAAEPLRLTNGLRVTIGL